MQGQRTYYFKEGFVLLSVILFEKLVSLYFIIAIGAIITKTGIIDSTDSKVLSKLLIYVINPCMIVSSLQINASNDVIEGLKISFLAALVLQSLMIAVVYIANKFLHFNKIEQLCLEYPNVGSIIIPIVSSVLGKEYIIYTLGFIVIENILLWTHAKMVISGENKVSIIKIIKNPTIIAILFSFSLMFLKIKIPMVLMESIDSINLMIGPIAMFIIGIILGGMNVKKEASKKRLWLTILGRLVLLPFFCFCALIVCKIPAAEMQIRKILFITFLGVCAPVANSIASLADVYGGDKDYPCAISILSTLSSIVSMPVFVYFYQKVFAI